MSQRKDYPVRWKGKDLFLSDLTIGIKRAYAKWLARDMLANAKAVMGPVEFNEFRESLMAAPPRWDTYPTPAISASFGGHNVAGHVYLNRLLFGLTTEEMTDDELEGLIREKEADPASDYSVAMRQITETHDPKAEPASTAGAASAPSTN